MISSTRPNRVRLFAYVLVFLWILVNPSLIYGQLVQIQETNSPDELVNELFLSDCISTSNIHSPNNGSPNGISSYGTFIKGNSNFPFESGIVLSTGNVNYALKCIYGFLRDNLKYFKR